jgi:hypothetical protein
MAFKHGPIYPGIADGLVFAIDPARKDSYPGTGTTVTDLKNSSTTGTMSGVVFSTNNDGTFNFDGSDAITSITVGSSYSIFSVGVWINPNSFTNFDRIIGLSEGLDITPRFRFLGLYGGGELITGYFNSPWVEPRTTATISTGAWSYITMVDNGTNTTIYINSNSHNNTSETFSGNSAPTSTSYLIGKYASGNYLDAQLGPIQLYNRVLSASEVLQNYNRVKSRFGL